MKTSEFFQSERVAFHDPLRSPGMLIMIDAQFISEIPFDIKDIRDLIRLNHELSEAKFELEKTAIITRSSFARVLETTILMLAEHLPLKLRIYNTLPDAIQWLGLQASEEEILQIEKDLLQRAQEEA